MRGDSLALNKSAIKPGSWRQELNNFIRAFAGGFLFGTPLLFTMEMWWIGTYSQPWKLFSLLVLSLLINLLLSYFSGFKNEKPTFLSVLNQALDAVAVGTMISIVVLVVLNRITITDPLDIILGNIVLQVLPLSIGVSLAGIVFAKSGGQQNGSGNSEAHPWLNILNDVGATAAGGFFIGFTIAPTQEVTVLAVEMGGFHLLALIILTLVVSYLIVFASGFDPQGPQQSKGLFQRPFPETILSYVVSLLVSGGALLIFAQIRLDDPLELTIVKILVLSFPTSIGGAAGRVAI